jgi:hypothetical protein
MTDRTWADALRQTTVAEPPCECGRYLKMVGYMVCRECVRRRHLELAIQRRADADDRREANP